MSASVRHVSHVRTNTMAVEPESSFMAKRT